MVSYPLLYTGNLHTHTTTYSGTATIISQLNTVSFIPPSIGPKQSVAILSSSKKKWNISGKFLLTVITPSGLWTRWRKDLPGLPVRSIMGLTASALQASNLLPMKSKPRVTLSYHTPRVSVKALKRWNTNPLQR